MELFGLVLAGGKSSRMGSDKALLSFHGVPQVEWIESILKKFCKKVFVSGSAKRIPGTFNFIEDHYDHGGPMNGILSAFRIHPEKPWLIVPVDMPNINQEAIQYLVDNHDEIHMGSCFQRADGHLEPLPAILNRQAYQQLLERFNNYQESLSDFLLTDGCITIHAPDQKWLININYPAQL